jgi:hypothetical protein
MGCSSGSRIAEREPSTLTATIDLPKGSVPISQFPSGDQSPGAPGSDERVLHGVLGLLRIPKDEAGGSIQAIDRGACQRGKGVMIAPSSSLHEFSLHDAPRGGTTCLAVLIEYGERVWVDRSDSLEPDSATIRVHSPDSRRSRPTA